MWTRHFVFQFLYYRPSNAFKSLHVLFMGALSYFKLGHKWTIARNLVFIYSLIIVIFLCVVRNKYSMLPSIECVSFLKCSYNCVTFICVFLLYGNGPVTVEIEAVANSTHFLNKYLLSIDAIGCTEFIFVPYLRDVALANCH